MSDDIREKAEGLIRDIEDASNGTSVAAIKNWGFYKELKAALKPSKQEVVEYLDAELDAGDITDEDVYNHVRWAVEYLREE